MKKVFLAGEGPNELGSRAKQTQEPTYPGVIETLLGRICSSGWQIKKAIYWKNITKYKPNSPEQAEARNVKGVALAAIESGCDVLVFSRDRDGSKHKERQKQIEQTLKSLEEDQDFRGLRVIGGVAIERLESWLCALLGEKKTEEKGKKAIEKILDEAGIIPKSTAAMVKIVADAKMDKLPEDAESLISWIDTARSVLGKKMIVKD